MLTDHRRQFEAVELGHADVDQHHPEIVFQEQLQSFVGRGGLDQVLAELAQYHLIAEQLARLIVDQQDIDLLLGTHDEPLSCGFPQRCSHMRKAESSCSVLTGLAR